MVGMDVGFENPLFASIELSYEEAVVGNGNGEAPPMGALSHKTYGKMGKHRKAHRKMEVYPLVNSHITMERSTMLIAKSTTHGRCSIAILTSPEGISSDYSRLMMINSM